MAVVKNLMVRVGADLSGFSAGMAKAGNSVGNFSKRTKQAMQESAASMSQLKNAMAQGDNNKKIISLTDQIKEIEAEQKAAKSMGFSWGYGSFEANEALLKDLKSQLQEYIDSLDTPVDGPEQWIAQLRELQGVQAGLKRGTDEFQANAATLETLNTKVREWTAGLQESVDAAMPLGAQLNAAKDALREMEAAGLTVGDGPWNQMYQEVSRLTQAVDEYKTSLTQAEERTGGLGSRLKSMASGTVSGLKSIGSRLLDIGRHAKSSHSGADKLSSALKKIGLTAGALKLVSSVTGRLRSIVSSYISENAALQSQVDSLKSSLGQALAPAINIVTNALSALMPYIVGVSNAIGTLLTNLFGKGWTTVASGASAAAAATGSAAAAQEAYNRTLAGFDEITKLDSNSSSGGGGGGSSGSTTTPVEGTLPDWLTDLSTRIQAAIAADDWEGVGAAVADKLGEAVDSARSKLNDSAFRSKVQSLTDRAARIINGFFAEMTYEDSTKNSIAWNTGALIGDAVALGLETAHQFLTTVNFGNIGKAVAQGINGALSRLSESDVSVGTVIADLINSGVHAAVGLIKNLDWAEVGRTIVRNLKDLIQNIDYAEIVSGLGSLLGGIGVSIWTIISDEITSVKDYYAQSIEEAGGSIGKGILNGIKKALLGGVDWILDNALIPFVEGLAEQWDGTWLGDQLNTALGGLNKFDLYIEGKLTELDTSKVEGEQLNVTAKFSNVKNSLTSKQTTLSTAAEYTSYKNSLTAKDTTVKSTADLSEYKVSLRPSSTIVDSRANLTTYKDSLRDTTVSTKANLTTYKDSLRNTTVSTRANLTTYKDSLNNTTVSTRANLTTYKDSLSNTTVSTRANLTTWKDSLSNKSLTFSANVVQGWTGSLASKLGISTVTSKLKLTVPTVSVDWVAVRNGGLSTSKPVFSVRYNAKGGILDSAQLFGMIGNTLQVGGEAGREALLPLDRNTGWMDMIAEKTAQKLAGGQQGGDISLTIPVTLDGKVITQVVVRNINATARATGVNPLAATM